MKIVVQKVYLDIFSKAKSKHSCADNWHNSCCLVCMFKLGLWHVPVWEDPYLSQTLHATLFWSMCFLVSCSYLYLSLRKSLLDILESWQQEGRSRIEVILVIQKEYLISACWSISSRSISSIEHCHMSKKKKTTTQQQQQQQKYPNWPQICDHC